MNLEFIDWMGLRQSFFFSVEDSGVLELKLFVNNHYVSNKSAYTVLFVVLNVRWRQFEKLFQL